MTQCCASVFGQNIFNIHRKMKWPTTKFMFSFPFTPDIFVRLMTRHQAFLTRLFSLTVFSKVEDGRKCHMLSWYGTVMVLSSMQIREQVKRWYIAAIIFCTVWMCTNTPFDYLLRWSKLPWPCTKWLHAFINVSCKILFCAALVMGIVFLFEFHKAKWGKGLRNAAYIWIIWALRVTIPGGNPSSGTGGVTAVQTCNLSSRLEISCYIAQRYMDINHQFDKRHVHILKHRHCQSDQRYFQVW